MLQGEILVFCLTFFFLRGHIFASIEKLGAHLSFGLLQCIYKIKTWIKNTQFGIAIYIHSI